MQGNCTDDQPVRWLDDLRPAMAQRVTRQCVLLASRDLLFWDVVNPGTDSPRAKISVWLSHLHLRAQRSPDAGNTVALLFWRPWNETGSSLWGSSLTLQGDTQPQSRGMFVENAPAFLEGACSCQRRPTC